MLKTQAIDEVPPRAHYEFSCGVEELDRYLHRFAKTNHKKGIGKTFLLINEECAIGFYTVSMASIDFNKLPEKIQSGIPKFPIPVARIGRLAVAKDHKSKGFGMFLLMDALARIAEAAKSVAAYCVVVDAKNKDVAKFYARYGFDSSKDDPLCLFLPMSTVAELVSGNGF